MRMEHSTLLELLHMFLYQRLDSNWHMLCNLTTHTANELRNSRVAQKYQNNSDFMQHIVQIVNQHQTRSTSCTTRNVAQHDWSWMGPLTFLTSAMRSVYCHTIPRSSNTLELYSVGFRFESRPGHST
jgi:hypothetical protein